MFLGKKKNWSPWTDGHGQGKNIWPSDYRQAGHNKKLTIGIFDKIWLYMYIKYFNFYDYLIWNLLRSQFQFKVFTVTTSFVLYSVFVNIAYLKYELGQVKFFFKFQKQKYHLSLLRFILHHKCRLKLWMPRPTNISHKEWQTCPYVHLDRLFVMLRCKVYIALHRYYSAKNVVSRRACGVDVWFWTRAKFFPLCHP